MALLKDGCSKPNIMGLMTVDALAIMTDITDNAGEMCLGLPY